MSVSHPADLRTREVRASPGASILFAGVLSALSWAIVIFATFKLVAHVLNGDYPGFPTSVLSGSNAWRTTARGNVADANHFTVTVKRVAESTDVDAHFTMPAHSLTVSPDGHLSIYGQYQSRAFSHGAWDSFEGHCLENRLLDRSGFSIGCGYGYDLLSPASLSAGRHPARRLAVPSLHLKLSRC